MSKEHVIIIGAGPAGMISAMKCAENSTFEKKITILEHKSKPAAKLLATGNGRCNFSNDVLDEESYRGNNPSFAYEIVNRITTKEILDFMETIGIISCDINGYYYPRSMQASTVADCLLSRLNALGVVIHCDTHVIAIKKEDKGYIVKTDSNNYYADKVIVAAGGKSYNKLGSDGSGFEILKELGHSIIKPLPGLISLIAKGIDFKLCQGVRAKGTVSLLADNELITSAFGEIQYTDYGISGIPVFQVSRYASKALDNKKKVTAIIDSLPEYNYNELLELLKSIGNDNPHKKIVELLNGFIPLKLSLTILKNCGVDSNTKVNKLESADYMNICSGLKKQSLIITSSSGFDKAQVTAGGVSTNEVNPNTMESVLHKGLYVVGELLDIDGNCGGYNIHFAIATGMIAGMSASEER
ncbi:MAG: NAD(P)/FAD-dependent oxidoreductase [Lachnospiraceae bacterium]|nr:NAD(P)/FAD-dependent oxidoreductase [Lachnospiraceae bacterium]